MSASATQREPANEHADPLAFAFREGSDKQLFEALVAHVASTFAVRAPAGVTVEWLEERARNCVGAFADLLGQR